MIVWDNCKKQQTNEQLLCTNWATGITDDITTQLRCQSIPVQLVFTHNEQHNWATTHCCHLSFQLAHLSSFIVPSTSFQCTSVCSISIFYFHCYIVSKRAVLCTTISSISYTSTRLLIAHIHAVRQSAATHSAFWHATVAQSKPYTHLSPCHKVSLLLEIHIKSVPVTNLISNYCPKSHTVYQNTNNEYCSALKCKNIIEAIICNKMTLTLTFI